MPSKTTPTPTLANARSRLAALCALRDAGDSAELDARVQAAVLEVLAAEAVARRPL